MEIRNSMSSRVGSSRMFVRLAALVVVVFALWQGLTGCAGNIAYHPLEPKRDSCIDGSQSPACSESYIQEFADHTIAFAEYSERGNVFDDQKLDNVLEMIRAKSNNNGVVVMLFIHGWMHNSNESDTNLVDFKRTVAEIASKPKDFKLGDRELVGLYVGWRGITSTLPLIKRLTFWERKAVAEQLGDGGLAQLVLQLDAIDSERAENLLVLIGHSFGGAALMSAVSKPLLGKVASEKPTTESGSYCERTVCGVGDGVYLINAAIEANTALPLYEAALSRVDYPDEQSPLLVSLSTEADLATKVAFPIGQTVGLLATSSQINIQRDYFKSRENEVPIELDEQHLDSGALGNFSPFLTHRIDVPAVEQSCANLFDVGEIQMEECQDYSQSNKCGPKRFPKGLERIPEGAYIEGRPKNFPLYFVRTDANFMSGHNDIFNPHVVAFLTAQLNARVLAADGLVSAQGNSLFTDSAYFAGEYKKTLQFSCSFLGAESEG